jgi:multiple sugar transport system permease protein
MIGIQKFRLIRKTYTYVFSILLAFVLAAPPLWMLLTAIKTPGITFKLPPVWLFTPTLQNYILVLQRPGILKIFSNTIIISVVTTAFVLFVGSFCAYSISRFHTGGRTLIYSTLIIRVMPPMVLGLPFFVLFNRIKLVDTLPGLILTYTTFSLPTVIWLLIAFFDDVPYELEEAARVDGASQTSAMLKVAFPLVRNGLVVTGLLTFISSWNHFFFALILAGHNAKTLPLEASSFITEWTIEWGPMSAMGGLLILPPVIALLIFQDKLVGGLTLGGLKG